MLDDVLQATGRVRLELFDETGRLKDVVEADNLVVDAGKGVIANRMLAAATLAAMTHMAAGTSNTAPSAAHTTLQAEVGRVALGGTSVAGAVITYTAAFGPGVATGALQEAGIFNAGAAGSMLCRTVFTTINKAAGDTLSVSWTVTIG